MLDFFDVYTISHPLSYFSGGKLIVKTIPVEIVLPDTRKLIVEQKGNCYFCSLYQLSEKKEYLQTVGTDGSLTLKIEDAIDLMSNFLVILQWIGENNAVTLFSNMRLFRDKK